MSERGRRSGEVALSDDGVGRLGLLASALSGRPLEVAAGAPGEPAWTDGRKVFLASGTGARDRLAGPLTDDAAVTSGLLEMIDVYLEDD